MCVCKNLVIISLENMNQNRIRNSKQFYLLQQQKIAEYSISIYKLKRPPTKA